MTGVQTCALPICWKTIGFAHSLIGKYYDKIITPNVMAQDAGKDIPNNAIVFNGADQIREFYDIQSQSNILDMLIENAYNEYMYDDALEKVLQEATALHEVDNNGGNEEPEDLVKSKLFENITAADLTINDLHVSIANMTKVGLNLDFTFTGEIGRAHV